MDPVVEADWIRPAKQHEKAEAEAGAEAPKAKTLEKAGAQAAARKAKTLEKAGAQAAAPKAKTLEKAGAQAQAPKAKTLEKAGAQAEAPTAKTHVKAEADDQTRLAYSFGWARDVKQAWRMPLGGPLQLWKVGCVFSFEIVCLGRVI